MRTTSNRNKSLSQQSLNDKIRQAYFFWLCDLVKISRARRDNSRMRLCKWLHEKEFYWTVPNDDNRCEDGQKLREKFSDEVLDEDCSCLDGPCTVFEMMVALSLRIEYILNDMGEGDQTGKWFGEMMDNLGLELASEDQPIDQKNAANDHNEVILKRFLDREYLADGTGGLFPLRKHYHHEDQRKIEIWYQLMEYIRINYPS